jgi:acyl-CoA synthetase (AMP-forming)/AMP-acid ligase II
MQQTILNLWKQNFKNNKNEDFFWDNILWKQTKKDFILKAYFIAEKIKKIDFKQDSGTSSEWQNLWIMLPALWWASLIITASYLAWKTPVMFNWTLPENAFDHCVDFSKVDKIITVKSFFDRVKTSFLEKYEQEWKFVFLEDLLKNASFGEKIKAFLNSIFLPIPKQKENDIAVILFTSWSESLPKAVPLTHKNLIENIKGAISVFKVKQDDILIWFLPPFHSFGFTVNTIMPLITWMRVVYTPDPNDAKTILEIIKHTKATALTATPTFLKMILNLASWDDLKSLKYAVVWAEKCPQDVFDKFKKLVPDGKILEWYWITECSPVVSINPVENPKPWTVWKVIPNLDCIIMDLDDSSPDLDIGIGKQWMILVSWSSVFNWYLDKNIENPFVEINWKKYYKTGDLWFLDEDEFLTITWRLKRFVKIAWEMISLPALEEIIAKKYLKEWENALAVEAVEKDGNVKIVLFSTYEISPDEVNDYIHKNWIPNLVKISENIVIDEIPVLWTWKTDYKELKKRIKF